MEIFVKHYGVIDLTEKFIVSDPCYDHGKEFEAAKDSQGTNLFDIYVGFTKECVPAFISINVIDEQFYDIGLEKAGIVTVDSGTMSIRTMNLFNGIIKNRKVFDEWYDKNVVNWDLTPNITEEGDAFVLLSGYGDGAYSVTKDSDDDGKVYRLAIRFIEPDIENGDDYDIIEMFSDEDEINSELFSEYC